MIELPTKKRKPTMTAPRTFTMFGQSKVGKTTKLAELENCLIIDTEQGARYVEALSVEVNSLKEIVDLIKTLKTTKKEKGENPYPIIAIDTLDKVVEWYETQIVIEHNALNDNKVSNYGNIPYGAGYGAIRDKVRSFIEHLKSVCDTLIIVAHRKKTIIGNETDLKVNANHLDFTGKLKNLLCAQTDAIGYVFREKDSGELMVSFATDDDLDGGTRVPKLAGKVIPFDWEIIFGNKPV